MYNSLYRFVTRIFSIFYGKIGLQKIFKGLFYMALDGLHYGKVHDPETDGEKWLVKKIYREYAGYRKTITVFDVGANRGDYTKMIVDIFRELDLKVHLFEPGTVIFTQLKKSLSGTNLVLNNSGFGDMPGKVTLHVPKSRLDMASIHYLAEDAVDEEVELDTIDHYCRENNIFNIQLLKLDVEGNEFSCLKGAKGMLKDHLISNIQFEFGNSNIHSRVFFKDIFDLLDGFDYDIYRLVKNGLVPIRKYHHSLEIFYTTNYFARVRNAKK